MEWIFSLGTAVVVIGVIISSIKKVTGASKKTTYKDSNDSPSAPKSGEEDYFGEIKTAVKQPAEKPKIPKSNKPSHPHPAATSSLRIEKAAVEDSMGDFQSEGCSEHYYDRFVAIPQKPDDKKLNEELLKIIVLGEVLNNPGFKKYRR